MTAEAMTIADAIRDAAVIVAGVYFFTNLLFSGH
jgi:hypothetical protein